MDIRHQFLSLRAASLFFAVIGCGVIASYAAGRLLPLWISAFILFLSVAALVAFLIAGTVGAISFLVYGFFALPFVHLIPYLFFDWNYQPAHLWIPGDLTIWGLATNPYMFDLETIKLTAELGAAGVSGLLAGMFARYARPEGRNDGFWKNVPPKTLNIVWFYGLLAMALVASKLASPARTIFEAEYAGVGTSSESLNFGSLGLVSYSLIILCLVDAIFDSNRRTGIWKLVALVCSILYVVIWLQFARGDRESIPMVIACAILFWRWGAPHFARSKSKIVALRALAVALVIVVMAAGFVLQSLRQNLVGKNLSDIVSIAEQSYSDLNPVGSKLSTSAATPRAAEAAQQPTGRGVLFDRIDRIIPKGTWSAVMLTPLSVAGDSLRGQLPMKLGQTYLDLILSIPPGFVASRLGYHRPIDADHGPAHEMRYGQGGTHAVVVPFMNFRIIGVVLILAAWGWLFASVERRTSNIDPPWAIQKVTAYGMTCAIIPQWIWYGEKILITGFFIWLAISAFYLFAATGRVAVDRSFARKNI
ncbi:hypothetical protein [Bradyrhizobium erythrophlei]|uniref:Oligosaccharide repeat unit polymerase n=1 Tax=Bradyrhizobium erythrophlei TaxID=1437360 RepID=A0A1M5SJ00_9BRAD|nr:hypothetical protein [Bradyrhizobium erythrophlei]SHH37883.1 hypothetical protein SAMN05443248_4608 [Bradyrhizobium erythrophlei]